MKIELMKINPMKITIFAVAFLSLLCAANAFGQTAPVLSNNPAPLQMVDHPQHASVHALAEEKAVIGGSTYTYAQGEQPLWEFGPAVKEEIPLGDIARAWRKAPAADRKAVRSFEKE